VTDQETLIGQAIGSLVGILILGFVIYKVIKAIAAFADALGGQPERSAGSEARHEDEEEE